MEIPKIKVGIMTGKTISFSLQGEYSCNGEKVDNAQIVTLHENQILWNNKRYNGCQKKTSP